MMPAIHCADVGCAYNKKDKCTAKKVFMSWHSIMTAYDGRQEFHRCGTREKSDMEKRMEVFFNGKEREKATGNEA